MAEPIRIGVAGVGFGATVHIPAFQSEGMEVVAVCSRRRERAEQTADRFGIPEAYIDFDQMLDEADLDAVSIVTPPALHHEMAMTALGAGLHVICEKPFALNQKQAREMWQKAEASGRTAMIAHEFRFASARMRAKELIEEGYIGKLNLALARLTMGPFRPSAGPAPFSAERDLAAQGAGFLFGLGSHYIDGLRHWFGEVESVEGAVMTLSPDRLAPNGETVKADADDTFSFRLHFRDGGFAEMIGTRAAPFGPPPVIEVYGTEGTLVTPQRGVNPPPHGTLLTARKGEEKLQEQAIPERLQPFADERDERLMPFRLFLREFLRGIETGTSPSPSFYDGYRCQQVLDAVRESSATGCRVSIALD
jgi:predicted dehydrogenase